MKAFYLFLIIVPLSFYLTVHAHNCVNSIFLR